MQKIIHDSFRPNFSFTRVVEISQNNGEFVTADTSKQVIFANTGSNTLRYPLQQGITNFMTQYVIYFSQMIKIKNQ
ncbi:hypothetical protein D3795_10665 [Pseudidiomarina andamanensis]|uniref:Uncharacterized protein n=1 Tax=Pseudidiomarina andamanensis TaxID=1940690 RepID=A0AA92EVB2_9GAMM|nr:hypothetical protein D3795_10665 [Pseudidiomarina andamanensis]